MKLIHKIIPEEFLYHLPDGMKFLHHNGREHLVIEKLLCPKGHSLMSHAVKLHGEASIKLHVKLTEHEGPIFVDAFWGSHEKLYSYIPGVEEMQHTADVQCPECGVSLLTDEPCGQEGCGFKQTILMYLPGMKNKIHVCAKLGCPWHRIDITEMPLDIARKISEINYFGEHSDDHFEGI